MDSYPIVRMEQLSLSIVTNLQARMTSSYPQYSTSIFQWCGKPWYVNITKTNSDSRPMLRSPQYVYPEYWLHSLTDGNSYALPVAGHVLCGLIGHDPGSTVLVKRLILKLLIRTT
jgi:hypothetical protein